MTPISKAGIKLGQSLALVYAGYSDVKAIIVGGSVARGYADEYSDLEIGVFWSLPPSDQDRKAAVENMGGDLWSFSSYDREQVKPVGEHVGLGDVVIDSQHYSGTAFIDLKHFTVDGVDMWLSDVVDHLDTSLEKQRLLSAIQNHVPLYGHDLLQYWENKADTYPKELAIKIVQENLWFGPWYRPNAYSERDDVLVLYQHFILMQQCILKVLAALNRFYLPSAEYKWTDQFVDEMKVKPQNISLRMKEVFRVSPAEGSRKLLDLIQETILLVEKFLPEVDSVSLFEGHEKVNLNWAKERWQTRPAYTMMQNIAEVNG